MKVLPVRWISNGIWFWMQQSWVFKIEDLFKAWERWAWYEPSDVDTYTSNLGPELTTNGTFNGNLTGWTWVGWVTNTLNASWNALITYSFASGWLFQDIPTTANIVKVVIRARMVQANVSLWTIPRTWNFNAPNTTTWLSNNTMQDYTFFVTRESTATGIRIYLNASTSWILEVESVSAKEVINIFNTCTMFQDSAWTTPVTWVEQPVWLMLDKSKSLTLWAEMITNWTFDVNKDWWLNSWTISAVGWRLRVSRSSWNVSRAYQQITCVVWKQYKVSLDRYKWTTSLTQILIQISSWTSVWAIFDNSATSDSRYTFVFTATQVNHWIFLQCWAWSDWQYAEFDNVSIKELQWNHAYQTTAIDRPILRRWIPNLQLHSNTYSNAVWAYANCAQSLATGEFIDWVQATRLTISGNGNSNYVVGTPLASVVGQTYTIATYVRQWTARYVQLTLPWEVAWLTQYANYDLQDWVVTFSTGWTASILAVNWWYIIAWSALCTLTTTTQSFWAIVIVDWPTALRVPAVNLSWQTILIATTWVFTWAYTADDLETKLWGIPITTTTSVNTRLWNWYLACNWTNSWMRTNNIDFSNTDKVTGFIWTRLLVWTGMQMLLETSSSYASNNWAFQLSLNDAGAWKLIPAYKAVAWTQYIMSSLATIPRSTVGTFAFNTALTPATWGITMRENWTNTTASPVWASTGTIFWNFPLFLFRRWWTSLPFNGNFYWLVLRGALCTTKEITNTEDYLTKRLW